MASSAGCIVLDSDYRKAPQNPFPACIQDAEDVCLYVLAHPEVYDVSKISVGGSSAGACIALAVGAKLGPEKIQAVSTKVEGYFYQLPRTVHLLIAFDSGLFYRTSHRLSTVVTSQESQSSRS